MIDVLQQARMRFAAGHVADAEALLRQHLQAEPNNGEVRVELARLLHARGHFTEALAELDRAAVPVPLLRASLLGRLNRVEEAIAMQRKAIADQEHPRALLGLGHLLKTAGQVEEAVAVNRRALALDQTLGEAWWSLSSLKTFNFTDADRDAMEALLADAGSSDDARTYVHLALAQALDAAGDAQGSWQHLAAGNAMQARVVRHDPADISALVDSTISKMDSGFFAAREGWGVDVAGPIFIVGMPRSGTTLLEQMLASHSTIEGTSELPYMPALARQLGRSGDRLGSHYLERLAALGPRDIEALGRAYLDLSRGQRRLNRPLFVDKMPNNWLLTGLIRIALPAAKIIDMRRNPLDCGLSNYRELFARGQTYSYDLAHIGRYYADYVRLMRHFDAVQPGKVLRVIYEELVDDPERELRRVFAYLGVEFEPQVLRFHETNRAVRTASAAQVRQPLNRRGIGQAGRYSEWLGPLREALGATLEDWDR